MADERTNAGLILHPDGAHLGIYLSTLAKTPEVADVYLVDPTGELFDQAKSVLQEKLQGTYRNTKTMFSEKSPKFTMISVEAAKSPREIEAALDAGSHVLVEKPACVDADDFATLIQKADSKHLQLMLPLANRSNPPILEARRLIRTGALGKIYGVDMHLIADQTRLRAAKYQSSWFADKSRAGGGHLIWLGIHWLDLAMYLTGLHMKEIGCLINNAGEQPINVEDSAVVTWRFDNGSLGTLTSAYYLDRGYHMHIKIWGADGWLQLGSLDEEPLRYEFYASRKIEEFTYPRGQGGYDAFVRAAVRSTLKLGEPPISNADSLRVLRTIFACYRSAAQRTVETLKRAGS